MRSSKSISRSVRRFWAAALVCALSALLCACGSGGGFGAEIQYVALGASDATGVGADPLTNGYVYLIRDDLTGHGKSTNLINLGIPTGKIHEIHEAADGITKIDQPDLVTIFVGANDMSAGADVPGFQAELDDILNHLVTNTDAFIVIGTLPDLTQLPSNIEHPNPDVTEARVAEFNRAIIAEAGKWGAAIADLRSLQNTGDVTSADGFHPNNEGYARIAAIFISVIDPHFFGETATTSTTTTLIQ